MVEKNSGPRFVSSNFGGEWRKKMMREGGFEGFREVEIFSSKWWECDQGEFLDEILYAYDKVYQLL